MQAASTVGVVNVDMLVVKRFETGRMAVPRHRDDQLDPHRLRGVYGPVYEGRGELVRHCLGRHERLLCIVVGPVSVRPSVRPSTCPPHHHLTPPQQVTSGPPNFSETKSEWKVLTCGGGGRGGGGVDALVGIQCWGKGYSGATLPLLQRGQGQQRREVPTAQHL
ncbi:hypothetical protein Pcinc_041506 [Petrolisthes cinctipes]|uniref:Uncharacterized protein n=1 Tax=Petrolisthes cinctipes TaxID=88211 RepID=A0AAE1EHQ7_PETCI|nr:hypothetical protein Pcinc_041506 [Petrolisthes cinctipes]